MNHITNSATPRGLLLTSCMAVATLAASPALAGPKPAGTLFLATSAYQGTRNTVTVGQPLPITPPVNAIANGVYPTVFNNDTVDGNFGITSPIFLDAFKVVSSGTGLLVLPATHYLAGVNSLDLSNSNTPDVYDPTNNDLAPSTYRTVVQYNIADGSVSTTPTDAYSGNNGRGAILAENANGAGQDEYLLVGNAGNGSGTPLTSIVQDTGVQVATPGVSPATTVIGTQQGTPGSKTGFQYGFSVTQLGDAADKSGKDDNFRGATVFGNTLYVSKGSGSNGVNTVYQVGVAGTLPTAATGASTSISILPGFPTGLAANIVEGDPMTEFYPFGIFVANANTIYVADEGSQDLNADPNAGLQKWIFNGTSWTLAYTIQAGLNLDQPYTVPNYPSNFSPATTGLRQLTGAVSGNTVTLFATTSTFSTLGDPGADPNAVVQIVDELDATSLPPGESFSILRNPVARTVYRGVAFVPVAQ